MKGSLLSSEIAEPYAQALMSLAQDSDRAEALGDEIRGLLALMEQSPDLQGFVANPVIDADDKKAVLRQVMGAEANPYLTNFVMLLVDKRRVILLEEVFQQYLALLRELNQTALAEVTAARELSPEQQQQIVERVKAIADVRDVEIQTSIDPDLIGGVVIKVGSKVIDASLRGQLRQISQRLRSST